MHARLMSHAQKVEFIRFGMDLVFLLWRRPICRTSSEFFSSKKATWWRPFRINKTIGWSL